MKAIVVVLAISFVAVLGKLTDEQIAQLEEWINCCIDETGVDLNVVEDAKKGQLADGDEKLACFVTCLIKKTGIMNDNGDVDWDSARAQAPSEMPQDQVDQIYNACKDVSGTGCEKGLNLLKCFIVNNNNEIL